jgi:hypothetical protein
MAAGIRKIDDEAKRERREMFAKLLAGETDRDDGVDDHPLMKLAAVLVASGNFTDRAHALRHLLHHKDGHQLVRTHKGVEPMDRIAELHDIMKCNGSPVPLAKYICESGAHGISESEFTSALTKYASELEPDKSSAVAFTRLYEGNETVRRAYVVVKAAAFSAVDIKPIVVTGPDARDVDDPKAAVAAYEEIVRLGRERYPYLSPAVQFARIFEDKNYAGLAARANRVRTGDVYRVKPYTDAYTKSDPNADTAYAELMRKAEAYREAHSGLSISQAFDKVYTDPANIEIAKRERVESAPR